jgi:hypothetical protein
MSNFLVFNYQMTAEGAACAHDKEVEIYTSRGTTTLTNPHLPKASEKNRALRVAAALEICENCPVRERCERLADDAPPMGEDGVVLAGIYFGTKDKIVKLVRTHNKKFPKAKIANFTKWAFRPVDDYDMSVDLMAKVIEQEIYKNRRDERAMEDAAWQAALQLLEG